MSDAGASAAGGVAVALRVAESNRKVQGLGFRACAQIVDTLG